MNGEEGSEQGNTAKHELPWASVFDAAANVRALNAIQAEGFKAASTLVDRFIRAATSGLSGTRPAMAEPLSNQQRADLFGATDLEPLIRSWWAMAGQLMLGAAPQPSEAASPPAPSGAAVDVATSDMTGQIALESEPPGPATGELWLHNTGVTDIGPVRLRCSDLMAADGAVVPAAAVALSPSEATLPARSSRGIAVSVEVTVDIAPGRYRGTLLVDGLPDLWLPVVLTVHPTAP